MDPDRGPDTSRPLRPAKPLQTRRWEQTELATLVPAVLGDAEIAQPVVRSLLHLHDTYPHLRWQGVTAMEGKDGVSIAGAYLAEYPGLLGVVIGPRTVPAGAALQAVPSQAYSECLAQLLPLVDAWGLELAQVVVDEETLELEPWLEAAGMLFLAELQQQRAMIGPVDRDESAGDSGWERMQPDTEAGASGIIEWLRSTYIDTLDCPVLNRYRTPEAAFAGYRDIARLEALSSRSSEWWGWRPASGAGPWLAGVLLSQVSERHWEIGYMGVAAGHRGRGLGRRALAWACHRVRRLAGESLWLAVDLENTTASRLYRQFGFEDWRRLRVWIAPRGQAHSPTRS